MSMTQRTSTPQMALELGIPIDPAFCKALQARIRTLLQAKTEGFPGSYPVHFEQSHLQLLANEEYFVLEKVTGVRYMLLSTHTPKGPACFLIDRHFEISYVPQLLLPLRDNPTKYQNETLLDGEMVVENDGNKKSLRFLVFDLMALNGTVVTQRSYSTRLGMMDQDVLAVQASKPSDVKSNEPFVIERKTMQRSYGLNIILSGSKRHKHGGEGLIFVPVRQPYIPGISPKLLKWKSHTTAQFQIKVTFSRERKPLYCIHVKQGTGTKFYDYVTPEPALALEWHTSTPDNKIAEFWWDPQWPTQMFEKGYGLETRTGGWKFYRVREDKKDADDEATVLALVKELETLVTKQQLESQIDHIRTQWKAREGGASSNGNTTQRLPVRSLSINNSHTDGQLSLMTSLSSHYLQSPSMASQSSSLGYFPKKDQERKSSVDDFGSSNSHSSSTSGTFSHPLPPKPSPFQSRQTSTDQSQPQPAAISNSNTNSTKSADQEHGSSSPSTISSSASSNQTVRKSTPPPVTSPVANSSMPSYSSSSATSTLAASPVPVTSTKNPLKLSQVPAHLQPIKSWMTVSPVPRALLGDKSVKTIRSERRDSRDSIVGSTSPRSVSSSSRKSSMSIIDTSKEPSVAAPNAALKSGDTTGAIESSPASLPSTLSTLQENQSQTPTPAHTPTPAGMSRPIVTPALPPTLALPPTSIAFHINPSSVEIATEDEKEQSVDPSFADYTTESTTESESPSVLGKRAVELSISAEYRSEDSLAQRRKLSDGLQYSPKAESPIISIGTPSLAASRSPNSSIRSPLAEQYGDHQVQKLSPLLSPISSPRTVAVSPDNRQISPRPSHSSRPRAMTSSKLLNELSTYVEGPTVDDDTASVVVEEEIVTAKGDPALPRDYQERIKRERSSIAMDEDIDMKNDSARPAVATGPLLTPVLTIAEQLACQPRTSHDKALAMANARAEAMSRIEKQAGEQTAKAEKMQEDIERFKENSRVRKEKAQKWKLQETIEAPVQDRRAQPVRQINQQQGRQLNSDAPVQRGQSQSAQRQVPSPQDQQRPVYSTRQSKAAFRTEAQQSAQNSPKTQPRGEQYPGQQKEQIQPSGETSPLPAAQKEQRTTASDPNSSNPNPGRSDQQTAGVPKQKMLHPSEAAHHHRRINSMDHQLHMAQSLNSLLPDQTTADQHELSEQLYGHPYSKRLDISQNGDLNHRRSHSDVGILYKPAITAIVQPQPIRDGPPMQRNLSPVRPDIEHRQAMYPPLATNIPTALHYEMDSPSTRNNNSLLSVTNEATLIKRESKARLQFILNDEDSGPESYGEEDAWEPRLSPEASRWSQRNPAQETAPKANVPPAEFGFRSPYLHDYGVPEHQGMHAPPNVPTLVMDPGAVRRQATKKQKLSQDITGMEQHFGARTDEYEHHMRQSQMHSLPSRAAPHPSQHSAPQPDRWPQQGHPPPPNSIQGPPSLALNHTRPHTPGRRNPGDGQVAPPGPLQQAPRSNSHPEYSGPEQPPHGSQTGRPLHHEQYPAPGPLAVQEGLRLPPERPTHSRHSSMTKAAIGPEHSHPQGPSYQATRVKSTQPHGQPDQYNRGYPPPSVGQPSGQIRSVPQSQQQQAQYHQQQQQTAAGVSARKKAPIVDEPHAGTFGGPQGLGAHAGYESRASHPQHLHSHQQVMQQQQQQQRPHIQHVSSNRHPDQEPMHDVEPPPGYHKQSHAPPQFRAVHHEQASAAGPQGFYEQEAHAANFASGRSSMYGSQSLHPSSIPEKQPASYPSYHVAGAPHDPSYRPYPGSGGMRSSSGNDLLPKDDHVRGGPGVRGSVNHLPPEHTASLHPSQRQHPQHPQNAPPQNSQQQQQPHDYRHGSAAFHHQQQQQQQQYPPQQKSMHSQDHPQYPPHHSPGQKVSSPRHGQLPVGGHPSEHDPNYRPQIPHGQGQGSGQAHGRGHGGLSW